MIQEERVYQEEWRPVVGFEGLYEVSNLGRVKRIMAGRGTNAKDGILKPNTSKKGYLRVFLSRNSKKYTKALHILVAKAWLPNPKGLPQVNHVDTIKANCRASNLEWASQVGNMQHAARNGLLGQGVYFYNAIGKWRATYNPKSRQRVVIGDFMNKEEALIARAAAVSTLSE